MTSLSWPVIGFIAWAVVLGAVGGLATDISDWYRNLRKPSFQPPDWLFGPAWTLILGLCAWAGTMAWAGAGSDAGRALIIGLYAANFVCDFLWSPLFFNLRRPDIALVEVVFLWASVLALCIGLRQFSVTASWLIVPYLAWVSFAAILNLAIVRLNSPFSARSTTT